MATRMQSAANSLFLIFGLILVIQLLPVAAFGAGNIPAAVSHVPCMSEVRGLSDCKFLGKLGRKSVYVSFELKAEVS